MCWINIKAWMPIFGRVGVCSGALNTCPWCPSAQLIIINAQASVATFPDKKHTRSSSHKTLCCVNYKTTLLWLKSSISVSNQGWEVGVNCFWFELRFEKHFDSLCPVSDWWEFGTLLWQDETMTLKDYWVPLRVWLCYWCLQQRKYNILVFSSDLIWKQPEVFFLKTMFWDDKSMVLARF